MKDRDRRGRGLREGRIEVFVRSIGEAARQYPGGITEKELLGLYSKGKVQEYVAEALIPAKQDYVVIEKDGKLYTPSSLQNRI